jgi:hypothetical protein
MNRKRQSKKPAKKQSSDMSRLVSLTQQILRLNERQTLKDEPEVPDVQPIQLSKRKVYTIQRSVDLGTITASVSVEVDGAYSFALSNLPDSASLTPDWDQYRILQVRLSFYPLFLDTSATVNYPPIHTVIDYDDSTATAQAQLNEYSTLMISQSGTYFSRVINPMFAVAAYGGAFTQFAPKRGWVDVASPGVLHYGLKYALPISGAANAVWTVTAHYTVSFRQTR